MSYPHDDERCRQDSVDAACFRAVCRALADADAPETLGAVEAVHWLASRPAATRRDVLAEVEALGLTCPEGCVGPWICDGSCVRGLAQDAGPELTVPQQERRHD